MKRSWYLITAILLIVVLAFTATAIVQAQAPGGKRAGQTGNQPRGFAIVPRGPMCPTAALMPPSIEWMQQVFVELGLTPEQQARAKDLVKTFQDKLAKIRSEGNPVQDLITELKTNPTDSTKVQTLANQAIKQESAILQAELEMWLALEKMLTPEQQTKFWDKVLTPRPMGPPPVGVTPQPGPTPPPPPQ
jgi:Spy/CpxP family protein refolding chaperone